MSLMAFDTLKYANQLKAVGVPSAQAEAQANVMAEAIAVNLKELATKADLRELRGELKQTEQRLDAKIDALGVRLDTKIDAIAAHLDTKIDAVAARSDAKLDALGARLDAKIEATALRYDANLNAAIADLKTLIQKTQSEQQLVRWMLGVIIAGVVGVVVRIYSVAQP